MEFLDSGGKVEPRHTRHHVVDHRDVGLDFLGNAGSILPAGRFAYDLPGVGSKHRLQEEQNVRFVVDQQNAQAALIGHSPILTSFRAEEETGDAPPLRVVIVDDVAEIRDIVSMMLDGDEHFRVVAQASEGTAAIIVAEREQPDVVLLDIAMPGMGGWEALPRIREVAPDAAVVLFSGDDNPAAVRRLAVERGARGHLQKGIEIRQLAAQLLDEIGSSTRRTDQESERPLPTLPDEPTAVALNRLTAIVDAVDEAVIAESRDGTILSWNSAAERIFGYTAEEMVGETAARLMPDGERDELEAIRARVAEGERIHLQTARRRKDGLVIDVVLRAVPITDADGAVVGSSKIITDLGDRDRRDRALARAIAQLDRQNRSLQQTNEELDRFAYVASHDLAQPLQVMYGYLELFHSEYGDSLDPTAAEWLRLVTKNLERMRRLVRDLLQYARTGAGTGRELTAVDCNEVLGDSISDLSALIEERRAMVSADRLPRVEGDSTQLGQVFQNLIGNAIKYTPADRDPVVHVSASQDGEMCRINVDDNGLGIAPEDQSRIFEMFQRANTNSEGSGLGLAIAKRVIEHLGGNLWVEERAPGGSRFSFTLRPAP